MHTITIGKDSYSPLPTTWNKLKPDQLLSICRLSQLELQPVEMKLMAFLAFQQFTLDKRPAARISDKDYFYLRCPGKRVYMVSVEDMIFLSSGLNWLLKKTEADDGTISWQMSSKLTKNLLPEISHKGIIYHGPSDAMTNCLYQEYIHTETFLDRHSTTKDTSYIDKLIAVLYRPAPLDLDRNSPDYPGDPRAPLNDFHIDARAEKLKELPGEVKSAIILFYSSCRDFLVYKFPNVFSSGGSCSGKKSNVFESHLNIIAALANNDVTKNEAIRKSYLYEVLNTLEQMMRQQKELENKYSKK